MIGIRLAIGSLCTVSLVVAHCGGCNWQRRAPFTINDVIVKGRAADGVEVAYAGYGEAPSRLEFHDPEKGAAILKALTLKSPLVRHDPDVAYSSHDRIGVIFNSTKEGYLFDLQFIGTAAVIVRYDGGEFIADLADDRAVQLLLRERASAVKQTTAGETQN